MNTALSIAITLWDSAWEQQKKPEKSRDDDDDDRQINRQKMTDGAVDNTQVMDRKK